MEALKFVVGEKRDILCVLPTGYGKSFVYQLLPDIFDAYDNKATSTSIVIVISPLNFLMEEQVNKLALVRCLFARARFLVRSQARSVLGWNLAQTKVWTN